MTDDRQGQDEQAAHARTQHWLDRFQSEAATQQVRAIKAEQARDAALARLAAAEAALERGRRVISDTLDQVVPDPCLCGTDEYCRECLAVGALEQALAALAGSREQAQGEGA